MITFDYMFFLTVLVIVTGVITLFDLLFLAKKRGLTKANWVTENSRSFFPILLLVLLIRAFLIQPYQVPTGSLEPTVMPGDFIVVSQFNYGLRLPVTNTKIIPIKEPKVGDIVLFRWPKNPKIIFVKRVIGTPGDHITYHNKILTINGDRAWQTPFGMDLDNEGDVPIPVQIKVEQLGTVTHKIAIRSGVNLGEDFDLVVPKNSYFMMGDNRDGSDDSRSWGFVPEENLIGKAFGIWMSWDSKNKNIRWERIGKPVR
jgi:signal peptidase I